MAIVKAVLWYIFAVFLFTSFGLIIRIPPDSMIENESLRELLQVGVTAVLLWLFFRYIRPFYSWFLPTTRRYEPTIQSRRLQGMLAEISMFTLIFVAPFTFVTFYQYTKIRKGFEDIAAQGGSFGETAEILLADKSELLSISMKTALDYWWVYLLLAIIGAAIVYFNRQEFAKAVVPIIRFFETGRFGRGGSARFAGLVEEWNMLFMHQGTNRIYLGESMYNPLLKIGIEDDRHMFTIGGSRGGKGVSAVIPNLIMWQGSVVCIDPKAVNTIVTAERRTLFGDVHIIDPFKQTTEHVDMSKAEISTASINPLDLIDKESFRARDDIKRLASALVIRSSGTKDPHWDDEAETVIAGMIAYILATKENPHLGMLSDLVYQSEDDMDKLWVEMGVTYEFESLARNAALGRIQAAGSDENKSVMVNVRKHLDWLGGGPTVEAMKHSNFHLPDIKEKPTSVYVVVPYEMLEVQARFVRLIINTIISQMTIGGRSKQPVLMIMDEFLALGYMKEIKQAIAVLAEFGLVLWPIVQELTSMEEIYGKNLSPFFTNSRAVQVFAISDEKSKDFVSKELGARALRKLLVNNNTNETVPFRTPDELEKEISRDANLQYVMMAGRAPMLLKKTPYQGYS